MIILFKITRTRLNDKFKTLKDLWLIDINISSTSGCENEEDKIIMYVFYSSILTKVCVIVYHYDEITLFGCILRTTANF